MIGAINMLVKMPIGDQTPNAMNEMGIVATDAKIGALTTSLTNRLLLPLRVRGSARHRAMDAEAESQNPTA